MLENLIRNLAQSLGHWAYLLVALMAMGETAAFLGFILPGEFTIIMGGVLAGEGALSIQLLIGIVWASIVIGDTIGFLLGRRLGRSWAVRHGPRVRLTEERLQRVEDYFRRHGGKTIFFGRWVGFVRPLMPFTAGASGLTYRRFLPYDVISAGLFGTCFSLLGYIFWNNFSRVTSIAGRGALGLGILAAVVIGTVWTVRKLRRPEERERLAAFFDRQGERPLLRPLAVVLRALWRAVLRPVWRFLVRPLAWVLAPPLRFVGHRLTPGGLGIEFTTLVAIAAVSLYVFIAYTDVLTSGTNLTPGDRTAIDLARDIESGSLTSAAKALTTLGTLWFAALWVGMVSFVLLVKRRAVDALVLAVGFVALEATVHIARAAVDRPRPGDALIDVHGSGFPSGHAATATAYLALAALLARAVRGQTARVALVVGGLVVGILVGLSRVYLRANYLSDVFSGWATGLAAFSICGALALVVFHLRNNGVLSHER